MHDVCWDNLTASKLRYKLHVSHTANIQLRFVKCDAIVHLIIGSYGMRKVLLFLFLIAPGNICCYTDAGVLPYSTLLKIVEM
jgi:hypothetical protein